MPDDPDIKTETTPQPKGQAPRLWTPIVTLTTGATVVLGSAAAVSDDHATWPALAAVGFVTIAVLAIQWMKGKSTKFCANLYKTRAALIVANVMLSSELAFLLARTEGWLGDTKEPESWTLEWLLLGLTAAAVEIVGFASERKRDKS